jgi:hypothetical protein
MNASSSTSGPSEGPDRERTLAAEYIAELTANLAKIARQHDLHALGLVLEMARLEAEGIVAAASAEPD